jgi:UDP-N-acetylmuramoyl-tripeptide--D-alanyl-D-alanine ligase
VAGSTNKAFAKNEILRQFRLAGRSVWANNKSLNTEIGLPLSILRIPSGYGSYCDWLPVIGQSLAALAQKNYPKYLILELGVSREGDMRHLLSIVKPKVSVLTDVTQRYLEGFSGMDDLVGEYKLLIKKTPRKGLVVLNFDNDRVRELAKFSSAPIETFGQSQGAAWLARNVRREALGERMDVVHDGLNQEHEVKAFGRHNVEAYLAGLIVNNYINNSAPKA